MYLNCHRGQETGLSGSFGASLMASLASCIVASYSGQTDCRELSVIKANIMMSPIRTSQLNSFFAVLFCESRSVCEIGKFAPIENFLLHGMLLLR